MDSKLDLLSVIGDLRFIIFGERCLVPLLYPLPLLPAAAYVRELKKENTGVRVLQGDGKLQSFPKITNHRSQITNNK